MNEIAHSVGDYLFDGLQEGEFLYAVLDGASIPDLLDNLYSETPPEFECLLRGELEPDMLEVAPYVVLLNRESEFAGWLFGNGWGKHWGLFLIAPSDLSTMRSHLQTFLMVHDPDGHPMMFRFYDPRVFRVYLPTCNAEEFGTVFGPIRAYVLEDEDPKMLIRFQHASGTLETEKLPLAQT